MPTRSPLPIAAGWWRRPAWCVPVPAVPVLVGPTAGTIPNAGREGSGDRLPAPARRARSRPECRSAVCLIHPEESRSLSSSAHRRGSTRVAPIVAEPTAAVPGTAFGVAPVRTASIRRRHPIAPSSGEPAATAIVPGISNQLSQPISTTTITPSSASTTHSAARERRCAEACTGIPEVGGPDCWAAAGSCTDPGAAGNRHEPGLRFPR